MATVQLSDSCEDLFDKLTAAGIERFWLVNRGGKLTCSNSIVENICQQVAALNDFNEHEAVFVELNQESKTIFAAFVHSTVRGQAQGGVRLLDHEHYGQFNSLVVDGLRLARGMTEKNATAEIWWGGGKGIICPVKTCSAEFGEVGSDQYPENRELLFKNYGRFIASIGGVYITAEDMNTSPLDMKTIHTECRFVTCLPPAMGGSSNPSRFTAEGVFVSMVVGIEHLQGKSPAPLADKRILVQGVGNVGRPLVDMLIEAGANVHLFDLNRAACIEIQNKYGSGRVAVFENTDGESFERFIELEGDVFSPNAIGAIVTKERIPRMNVRLIAGGANNQLRTRDLAQTLHDREILYLPDFLINCMGIVNCANEQYGYTESKIAEEVSKLRARVTSLLQDTSSGRSVYEMAIEKSKELASQSHPLWAGNGKSLIGSLVDSDWAR